MADILLIPISLLFLSGCAATSGPHANSPVTRTGFAFDTVIQVGIYEMDNGAGADSNVPGSDADSPAGAADSLLSSCMELAAHYEQLFSATRQGSDIWNINHAEGQPVAVDPETLYLVQTALSYAELSDGRFDPTIGVVSDLWQFDQMVAAEEGATSLPDEGKLSEALTHVDYRNVVVTSSTVQLLDPDARLDLGAIAKGYIADRMKEALLSGGARSAIINLGGNVLLVGDHAGLPFQVGIQKPFGGSGESAAVIPLSDKSLVTSGVYQRCFTYEGKRYHHILDTRTGMPVDNGLTSVTILSDLSVDGDALSTVCFTLGEDEGLALIESLPDTEALFLHEDGSMTASSGFPNVNR